MRESKYGLPLFPQRVADGGIATEKVERNGLPRANERAKAQVAIDGYAPVTARIA